MVSVTSIGTHSSRTEKRAPRARDAAHNSHGCKNVRHARPELAVRLPGNMYAAVGSSTPSESEVSISQVLCRVMSMQGINMSIRSSRD